LVDNIYSYEQEIYLKFKSMDSMINTTLTCKTNENFNSVIKKLCDIYPYLIGKNMNFLVNANIISKDKTIKENNINNNSVVVIIFNEETKNISDHTNSNYYNLNYISNNNSEFRDIQNIENIDNNNINEYIDISNNTNLETNNNTYSNLETTNYTSNQKIDNINVNNFDFDLNNIINNING
jgi:hypothetical protein